MNGGGPGASEDVEVDEVTTRGWRLTPTGRSHTLELGAIAPLHDSPDAVFLDDDLLVAVPALEDGEPWAHHFALDGCLVSLEAVRHTGERQLDFYLTVDDVDMGPPGPIGGRAFRPAIGSRADRLRDRGIIAIAVGMFGLAGGVLVPIVGGWQADEAWLAFAIMLGALLAAGIALIVVSRDRRLPSPLRDASWAVMVLDLGIIIGAALTTALIAGPFVADRDALADNVGLIGMALFTISIGVVGLAGVIRREQRGVPITLSSTSLIAIGSLVGGAGLLLMSLRLLGQDPEAAPRDDLVYLFGAALMAVGVIVVKANKFFEDH